MFFYSFWWGVGGIKYVPVLFKIYAQKILISDFYAFVIIYFLYNHPTVLSTQDNFVMALKLT